MNRYYTKRCVLAALFWSLVSSAAAADISMLIYHRFGEADLPSTNVTLEQLENHIELIKSGAYTTLSVSDLEPILKQGAPMPDQGLVFTADDAFRSFMTEAWPRLKAAGIPATLFISTDPVDNATPNSRYLTWDDVRALKADGVEIGHHGAGHIHLPRIPLEQAIADIERASEVFMRELGEVPDIFAYPYGEYNADLAKYLEEQGFKIALAQYSSAIDERSDPYALPRFPMNERYGDTARFRLVSRALALPAKDILPRDPELSLENNPPLFGFTVSQNIPNLSSLNCYPSHLGEPAKIETLPSETGSLRLEVRFEKPFPKGRSRINCTMQDRSGRWYWFGRPFFVPGGALN